MTALSSLTNRRLEKATDLEGLTFDGAGLLPVVVQDAGSGDVLMVAWANREALEKTLATGDMHFWSRSRAALWRKGETSGNAQALASLHADCDGDTLLARVVPAGPACHTGERTCFGEGALQDKDAVADRLDPAPSASVLAELWEVIEARDRERPEGSYTTRLLSDPNRRMKKLGEETAELISAIASGGANVPDEAADLIYHLLVALKGAGRSWSEVEEELRKRRG
ncbi:MAG: bifunctional phosphoribosyl-AMP cyclohydrolase/phosphoribosyl-ATP diphosphatase HisIE [Gemmatimonadota bacterium]